MVAITKRRTKRRDPTRSRQAILNAAENPFADRGYEAATMADIAAEAGLSSGLSAYFFSSQEELHKSALSRAFADMTSLVKSKPFGSGDPQANITETVGSYIEFLAARPKFVRLVVRECLDGCRLLKGLPVDDDPALCRDWIPAFCAEARAPAPLHVPAWLARALGGPLAGLLADVRGASNARARLELDWTPSHRTWREGFFSATADAGRADAKPLPAAGARCGGGQ